MKKLIIFLVANVIAINIVFSQGAAINASGTPAAPSAILDVSSTTQGQLIPRMTNVQRNAIFSPAEGLQIYISPVWQSIYCGCNLPSAPTAGTNVSSQTQIVWNWNAVNGASGYQWNTSNTYPGMGINVVANPNYTLTGLTCNTSYSLYVWANNACGVSSLTTLNQSTSTCPWFCGSPLAITHTIGNIAPETKTVNYGTVSTTLGGTGAKCWITQNLGSSNQATSATDNTEASAGWYWQFNRRQGYKHDGTTRTPSTTWDATNDNMSTTWEAAKDPCSIELGTGWRIPTYTEWLNADATASWNNYNDAYNSVLKLHAAGHLIYNSGSLFNRGIHGVYWCSTQYGDPHGWSLYLPSTASYMNGDYKAVGFSLRCLKD